METDADTLRERIRSSWKTCKDLDAFISLAQLDENTTRRIWLLWDADDKNHGDFQTWLKTEANTYLTLVLTFLSSKQLSGIQKISHPFSPPEDDVVSIYPDFLRIALFWKASFNQEYCDLLVRVFPETRSPPPTESESQPLRNLAIQKAFNNDSKERDITTTAYRQIVGHFNHYNPGMHLAPYVSIIGPSGIGKSKMVQQFAERGHAYIAYACLALPGSGSYPRRSPIADLISHTRDRTLVTTLFECIIAAMMVNVELSKNVGITPGGFFHIQVHENFESFQESIAVLVKRWYEHAWKELTNKTVSGPHRSDAASPDIAKLSISGSPIATRHRSDKYDTSGQEMKFDHKDYVNKFREEYHNQALVEFHTAKDQLLNVPSFARHVKEGFRWEEKRNEPEALICFDEVEELFKEEKMKFLALRRAMRHRSHLVNMSSSIQFFGLLLDTVSRISDLSPPRRYDPSLKLSTPRDLFKPIFQIDTMDMFRPSAHNSYHPNDLMSEDSKIETVMNLFSFGRPLWGALMESGDLKMALSIAEEKLYGGRGKPDKAVLTDVESLALIQHRLNFYVVSNSVAEVLTSGYLRYVVGVNDERTLLRTYQPSEPILAYIAAQEMLTYPDRRLSAIGALHSCASNGFIHLGDIGEVVSAMILLFTFDQSTKGLLPAPRNLMRFLSAMFQEPFAKELGARFADNSHMSALEHGTVFFIHFVRVEKVPSWDTIRDAYSRGAAIFLPQNFQGADILLPVYMSNSNAYSFVLVQVKNQRDLKFTPHTHLEATQAFYSAMLHLPGGPEHPYVGIYMSLRGAKDGMDDDAMILYPQARPQEEGRRLTRQQAAMPRDQVYDWNDRNRIVIGTCGLHDEAFPGIRSFRASSADPLTKDLVHILQNMLYLSQDFPMSSDMYYQRLRPLS